MARKARFARVSGHRAGDPKEDKVETKVIYLNLPVDVAALLEAEAAAEERPTSVQAGRIIKQYFDAKKKS
jgi:hypothetical protein